MWILGLIILIWLLIPSPAVVYIPPTEVNLVIEERWPPWQPIELEEGYYERYQRKEEED
jgi:hypothetical protein